MSQGAAPRKLTPSIRPSIHASIHLSIHPSPSPIRSSKYLYLPRFRAGLAVDMHMDEGVPALLCTWFAGSRNPLIPLCIMTSLRRSSTKCRKGWPHLVYCDLRLRQAVGGQHQPPSSHFVPPFHCWVPHSFKENLFNSWGAKPFRFLGGVEVLRLSSIHRLQECQPFSPPCMAGCVYGCNPDFSRRWGVQFTAHCLQCTGFMATFLIRTQLAQKRNLSQEVRFLIGD